MKKPLLIEIGVEELPAIPFLKELPNIKPKWQKILDEFSLEAKFEFFYTPRRLILWHREFPLKQDDTTIELFGAPIDIAYKDGKPTQAALGFAKKCGVDIESISTTKKGDKEVLYYKKSQKGKESSQLLEQMLREFLSSLNFGKSMRWGTLKESFIRPIRSISVMLGDGVVDVELYDMKSSNLSFPHRSISYEPFSHNGAGDYFCKLDKSGVIAYQDERKNIILEQFSTIEAKHDLKIQIDNDLLAEVVAITENPHALIGEFDESFLKLPDEVIILSMKEHQRYFATYKDGKLTNRFIVVSNSICDNYTKVIKGNEKVLKARLSDGLFFWQSDLKRGLSSDGLKNISFIEGGGSLYDKTEREKEIANYLVDIFKLDLSTKLDRTFKLTKADLLTDMVYEFTELQGVMGYYYAKEAGEDSDIALAIKEQYLPSGDDSELPSSDLSAVVALSYKLDTLLKLFELGNIPTGSKDPFGLRRAVVGVIKIVLDRGYQFDIKSDLENMAQNYNSIDLDRLNEFFLERLTQYFGVNPSLISAVLHSGERDIVEISKKLKALDEIVKESDFREISSTFKRVANIIKDMDLNPKNIDETLFQEDAEKKLYEDFKELSSKNFDSYKDRLKALFGLKDSIDNFFDSVMVNVDNKKIKENRKALIHSIYLSFREIADIKEITF